MNKKIFFSFLFAIPLIKVVSAHCPLCTIGAGAAAAGASMIGVSHIVIALFMGAFAMSMGLWFSKVIKKQYIPFQKTLITLVIFFTTVLPLLPLFSQTSGFHLSLMGGYGSLLNRTYLVNVSLLSSFFGGILVFSSPRISQSLTKLRKGKFIPYQGVTITLSLLVVIGVLFQFLL